MPGKKQQQQKQNTPTLEQLLAKACLIRPVLSPVLSSVVLKDIARHRDSILSSSNREQIENYINRATDAECLCALSEMYLGGPLNDSYYHLFTYLVVQVFTTLGLEVPQDVTEAGRADLTASEKNELESFRLGIRLTQRRTMPKGGH